LIQLSKLGVNLGTPILQRRKQMPSESLKQKEEAGSWLLLLLLPT